MLGLQCISPMLVPLLELCCNYSHVVARVDTRTEGEVEGEGEVALSSCSVYFEVKGRYPKIQIF